MKKILNKSFFTYSIAIAIIVFAYLCPFYPKVIKYIGFFALSGAMTNGLAIHMLFEKVPLLYGSGVIPNHFEEFKLSIKDLMMKQFFTVEIVEQFIHAKEKQGETIINVEPLMEAIDYDKVYEGLVASIMESSFGSMLLMMGGEEALVSLKVPFSEKMKHILTEVVASNRFRKALDQVLDADKISENVITKVETVIDNRLNELTPQLVKEIMQEIIRQHLGWLVVWGGVFGGVMGAGFSFV